MPRLACGSFGDPDLKMLSVVDSDADGVLTLIGSHLRVHALLMGETRLGSAQHLKVTQPSPISLSFFWSSAADEGAHPLFQFAAIAAIALHQAPDRGMVRFQAAFLQELFDIPKR